MQKFSRFIEILPLYSGVSGDLSSVCGVVSYRGEKRLFSIRCSNRYCDSWNGWESSVPNSWTLRGSIFSGPNRTFPTWRDALEFVRFVIGEDE